MKWDALFGFVKKNRVLLITGVLSLACLLYVGGSREVAEPVAEPENYAGDLERELERILSRVAGVGSCEVLVTLRDRGETLYATEVAEKREYRDGSQAREDTDTSYRTLRSGSDEVPIVLAEYTPEICGVMVVCDGGGSDALRLQIRNMLATVLGIPGSAIYVAEKQK